MSDALPRAPVSPDRCDRLSAEDFDNGLGVTERWVEMRDGEPVIEHLVACEGAWRSSQLLVAVSFADFERAARADT